MRSRVFHSVFVFWSQGPRSTKCQNCNTVIQAEQNMWALFWKIFKHLSQAKSVHVLKWNLAVLKASCSDGLYEQNMNNFFVAPRLIPADCSFISSPAVLQNIPDSPLLFPPPQKKKRKKKKKKRMIISDTAFYSMVIFDSHKKYEYTMRGFWPARACTPGIFPTFCNCDLHIYTLMPVWVTLTVSRPQGCLPQQQQHRTSLIFLTRFHLS